MAKLNHRFPENRMQKIEQNLSELIAAVHDHERQLEKHIGAMDKLAQDVHRLETLMQREAVRDSCRLSMQLREAVKSFVEYQINPYFYQNTNTVRIKAGPKVVRSALAPGKFSPEAEPTLEQVQ
jgi:hypothetical protein